MAKEITANPITGEIELPAKRRSVRAKPSKLQEIFGVLLSVSALFFLLSLLSYDGVNPDTGQPVGSNLVGLAGEWTAYIMFTLFGCTVYLLDGFMWLGAVSLFFSNVTKIQPKLFLGMLLVGLFASAIVHTGFKGDLILGGHTAGGFLGELIGEILISVVSTAGTYLVSLGAILLIVLLVTEISLASALQSGTRAFAIGAQAAGRLGIRVVRAWYAKPEKGVPGELPKNAAGEPEKRSPEQKSENKSDNENRGVGEIKIVKQQPIKDEKAPKNKKDKALEIEHRSPHKGVYRLPPVSLLTSPPEDAGQSDVDEQKLKKIAEKLTGILADFDIFGEIREIHPGPVVTMFEFQPKSGTKLSTIENRSKEIAMALEVMRVRVVAPIPGKNAVGFELPNYEREIVYLREMVVHAGFSERKLKLPLSLGKDISGLPYFVDLAKMPHLLIAGTTGSGKSVALNAILLSLLYKYAPEDLRLLLVDPKMIELGSYDKIPHLLLPVVTDMSKACLALKWAVDEMERRYQLFADLSVRNLAAYNKRIESLLSGHAGDAGKLDRDEDKDSGFALEGDEVVVVSDKAATPEKLEKLPFIVIVVDELSDLMMTAAKDVEQSITRLAQKARAAGIHLVLATQRPSVDVITGLIKANFPSRISFRVASIHDSRTIIGTEGAENLLGNGDMLFLPPGTSDLVRVHGAFVDDDEIKRVIDFVREQGKPMYDEEILKPREDEELGESYETEKDEIYDQAVRIVADSQVCSISMLQRRLRIGFNRSARIVEIMEKEGVVGPANGVNKREVLISPQ